MQPPPVRNAYTVAASVYSHSGEFAPDATDLRLPGRGLDLELTRSYRSSLAGSVRELGRGWSAGVARRLERDGEDILLHTGDGTVQRFGAVRGGRYDGQDGVYATLGPERRGFVVQGRFGLSSHFEDPDQGGRIVAHRDRHANEIAFAYAPDAIEIRDTLQRAVTIELVGGRFTTVTDGTGRVWSYRYDAEDRLVEVLQPATADFPSGTSLSYAYDDGHRLIALTDAKGQTSLVNRYDAEGRVIAQDHGNGVYELAYETVGESAAGWPVHRTRCRGGDGGTLVVEHDDGGHAVLRTLGVRRESFDTEDLPAGAGAEVPVVTSSAYNGNGELVSRRHPGGHETTWAYPERSRNLLDRGNVSQVTELPQAGVETDQDRLVTTYTYEPAFQLVASCTGPRGHTTTYRYDERGNRIATLYPPLAGETYQRTCAYNEQGQLLRVTHTDGSVTECHYYPVEDPYGARGPSTATAAPDQACGYLARVVRDAAGARVTNEYGYDELGNLAAVFDGKGNAARMRHNAMGRLERVSGRAPDEHEITYRYDANYNEIESILTFERHVHDEASGRTTLVSTTRREVREYDALDNVVARRVEADDSAVSEAFVRDAGERIVRHLRPLGGMTEYRFDERGLLIERISAAGTSEAVTERFTHTLDGDERTASDGNGNTTRRHYDGFRRCRGVTDPSGTSKTQWLDEAGNAVRVRVEDLMEAEYRFDEWNRAHRIDRAWRDEQGERGVASTVVEYGANGLPALIRSEPDDIATFSYDGAGRVVEARDATGDAYFYEYDENGNVTLVGHRGPDGDHVVRRTHDSMDRLESQRENEGAAERLRYNALGAVIGYVAPSGLEIQHLSDALGRATGHAVEIADSQRVVRRYEHDDDSRLTAYVDATGGRTVYAYDAAGRQTSVGYPDDSSAGVSYDGAGNVVREWDPSARETVNRYDANDRLVERVSRAAGARRSVTERYGYDRAGRLLSAAGPGSDVRRTYDSLSRLLTESDGDRTVAYEYGSAEQPAVIRYPGGDELHCSYDRGNRLAAVTDRDGATLASYRYRPDGQVEAAVLGDTLEVARSYDGGQRLEAIEYRTAGGRELVEGFRYAYDRAGRMTHEIESGAGATFGERYAFDGAGRPTRARYGVEDVTDPDSAFESETSYEHFPDGSWSRRVDVDGRDGRVQEQAGRLDGRNRYREFGDLAFTYDANGNCVRKGRSNPGYWIYTYDEDNRLVKAESFDATGALTQTIEYVYDALGRQVRKVVTDQRGLVTEYGYVWAGSFLIEEYENGVLTRSYLYGLGATPVRLSSHVNGRRDYTYVLNGRGLTTGLVDSNDPNRFAEKYVYELTGGYFMKEIGGVRIGLPDRAATASSLSNSILSGDYFGSVMADWSTGTLFGARGGHLDPTIGAVLNSVGAGHKGVKGALGAQMMGWLGTIGRGGRAAASPGSSQHGGAGGNPKMSLYAAGENTPFNFSYSLPPVPKDTGGSGPKDARVAAIEDAFRAVKGAAETPFSVGPIEGTLGGLVAGVGKGLAAPATEPQKAAPEVQQPKLTEGEQQAEKEKKEAADKEKKEAEQRERTEKAKKEEEEKKKKEKKPYVNPDADIGAGWTMPSPAQIEAKLNQRTRPVNPNGGVSTPQIDPSSPPPRHGGLDPTVALFDPEGDVLDASVLPRISIAPITYVRGHEPIHPDGPPPRPGQNPNTGQPLP